MLFNCYKKIIIKQLNSLDMKKLFQVLTCLVVVALICWAYVSYNTSYKLIGKGILQSVYTYTYYDIEAKRTDYIIALIDNEKTTIINKNDWSTGGDITQCLNSKVYVFKVGSRYAIGSSPTIQDQVLERYKEDNLITFCVCMGGFIFIVICLRKIDN